MTLTTVTGRHGMVTAPHHLAAQAGCDILKDGGNAVEAAVAVAATLAVVYPHMTGIGGDSFWLIAEPDGVVHSVHGCGGAAAKADLSLYADYAAVPTRGPLAANTVAGTVSGWGAMLASGGGSLPLARLMRDAIHHAETGVLVTRGGAGIAAAKGDELRIQPGAYRMIFEPDGRSLREGDRLRQPALAATLRLIAENGTADFYHGVLADMIAQDLAAVGSPVSRADLAAHIATRPAPLRARISGIDLFNSAPPTQGFASLMILALFDRLHADGPDSFDHVHGLVEATKQAFLLRDTHVGDPAWHDVDLQALLEDPIALDQLAANIDPDKAMPWPQPS
ncbi:MAG: gamma-glutamyltransferase, partial [bacterium]|nr:gamma-glutamyltransferase [bacterium]